MSGNPFDEHTQMWAERDRCAPPVASTAIEVGVAVVAGLMSNPSADAPGAASPLTLVGVVAEAIRHWAAPEDVGCDMDELRSSVIAHDAVDAIREALAGPDGERFAFELGFVVFPRYDVTPDGSSVFRLPEPAECREKEPRT